MKRAAKRLVFTFTGKFEQQNGRVFAKCDHAPLLSYGADEDEALERLQHVMDAYLQMLDQRGEIDLAIQMGKVHVELVAAPSDEPSPSWSIPRFGKSNSSFFAQMPSLAAI